MCMRTRGHQKMVTETSKTINFGAILFITWLYVYWIAKQPYSLI